MEALVCEAFSTPPGLARRQVPVPSPRPGEVLVRVAAAGLGFVDALICAGRYQLRPDLPFTPATEAAGWVEAVGEGVRSLTPGDRVAALVAGGALAQFAISKEALAAKIPDALPFRTAAACVTNYCTVAYGLAALGRAAAGETLLVLGAGGGLGLAAIDFARAHGLQAVALASTAEKRQAALGQGAALAIDYGADDWRAEVERHLGKGPADIVFDAVGGPASEPAFRLLRPGGRHLVVGFASGDIARLPMNLPLLKRSALVGVDWGGAVRADHALFRPTFAPVAAALAAGALRPGRVEAVPLDAAGDALGRLSARQAHGKIVVDLVEGAG